VRVLLLKLREQREIGVVVAGINGNARAIRLQPRESVYMGQQAGGDVVYVIVLLVSLCGK
jgi:hypothetical protein